MTVIDPDTLESEARRARLFTRINKADAWFQVLGLAWLTPMLKAVAGDNPKAQMSEIWRLLGVPLLAIAIFIGAWATLAPTVQTSLGAIPGPVQVWEQAISLNADAVREREKEAAFYERQDARNAKLVASGKADKVKERVYTGKPTYYQQIWTSIKTVFFGFLIGSLIAIPLGILAGLSATANAAINPIIQIFKPVSPLAWLP
ncbi:MAG: nitrate/nitrite transport system permease protein, partial [Sulfitobacter sp.]